MCRFVFLIQTNFTIAKKNRHSTNKQDQKNYFMGCPWSAHKAPHQSIITLTICS